MNKSKGLSAATGLIVLAAACAGLSAAPAQQPITSASPAALATAPGAGTASPMVTSPTPPPAAAVPTATASSASTAAPAKAKIPEFYGPTPGIGQPTDVIALQPQVTALGQYAAWFHNDILVPIIFAVSLLVLVLLFWVMARFNRRSNPTPSATSHNTVLEVLWTVAPVLILLGIAVPSIKLLAAQYDTPKPDLTVKVIGHQWYWSYQYPDNGDFEVVSNILTDAQDKATGQPRQLGVDERMVVPVDSVVKVITTSDDVIHSFAVPAFWTKMDAVPGRLNETWFKVQRPGLYYGQCSELCGARHGYMPIAVEVVTKPQFAQWIAARGGTMKGAVKAKSPDATEKSPISNPGPATVNAGTFGGAVENAATENVTAAAPADTQRATNN